MAVGVIFQGLFCIFSSFMDQSGSEFIFQGPKWHITQFDSGVFFEDNPVGAGYSYVEDKSLFVKTDVEAGTDLTTLLIAIFNKDESLQKRPVFFVSESYGGKYAVTLALSALKAIEDKKLKLQLGGVALGDSWISPEDFVLSYGPLLKDISRIDDNGLKKINSIAYKIIWQLKEGKFLDASNSSREINHELFFSSNYVDIYNFLEEVPPPTSSSAMEPRFFEETSMKRYSNYLTKMQSRSSSPTSGGDHDDFGDFLNIVIRKKLKIIPENVKWGGQTQDVYENLQGDLMKSRIHEVDELLAKGVNVTVYNGQLDLICATKGAEAWVRKLKWEGLQNFLGKDRTPLYCGNNKTTQGFVRSYKNLHFYWILGAGHFVPLEQPCVALDMIGSITQSPGT